MRSSLDAGGAGRCPARRTQMMSGGEAASMAGSHPEITTHEASSAWIRMKSADFPVIKTLDELARSACSIPGTRDPWQCGR
jgi:hypothetical protein